MANQKLNEVTTVPTASINNVKTFLAVMNDGSIQQMTKADMASVLGELLPEATTEKKGLMPKNLVTIRLTEHHAWYEITGDCSFYYRYSHPYSAKMVICTIMSNWSNANGFIKEILSGGSDIGELSEYVRVASDNTKKKIYVRCYNQSDGSVGTYIIPIYGTLSIKVTSDIN